MADSPFVPAIFYKKPMLALRWLETAFGFETTMDAELQPGFRWVELGLPGAESTIALVAAGDQLPAGIDTGIRLLVGDARAAHRDVAAAGGSVGELLDWPGVPLMFSFTDPDGNRVYVAEGG